jgi:hypothetical protein
MQPYISPGMTASVRHMFERGMQHTYDLTPYTYGAKDGYGRRPRTAGAVVTGVKCRYLPKPLIREYDTGRTTLVVPPVTDDTLLVHWDDPIKVGDHVTNIRALPVNGEAEGRLIFTKMQEDGTVVAGEAIVVSEADHSGLGPVTLRRLVLRDPEEQEVFPVG